MRLDFWNEQAPQSDAARVDEHAANAGAANVPPASSASSPAAHQVGASAQAAEQLAATSTRRKRRSAGSDAQVSASDSRTLQDQIDGAIRAQLDALHEPKAWGALLAAPGDALVALTGKELWEVTKDEREVLGVTGAAAARTLMIKDPKMLALMMLAGSLFSVYGLRAVKELREMAKKKKGEQNAATS